MTSTPVPRTFNTKALRPTLVLLASLTPSIESYAESEFLTEADWLTQIPQVLSATRQQQSITQAPSSVTLITRRMIDAQGAVNVAEILSLVPGFQVFYSNGSTFGVTSHGYADRDPRRLEVRVNGRSVYMPQLSSVAWESLGLLPDDIDHIEVVRGSNVPAYGSNAILGAINIVTRNPVKDSGGDFKVSSGSQNSRVVNSHQTYSVDAMDLSIRTAYKESDGFDHISDEAHVGHLVLNGVYTPNLADALDFEIGFSNGDFGTGDTDHLDWIVDEKRNAAWISGNWQHTGENQLWKLHASYADYTFEKYRSVLFSEEAEVPPSAVPSIFPGHSDELIEMEEGRRDYGVLNLELEHHLQLNENTKTIWGLGSRTDRAKSDWLEGNGYTDTSVHYLFGNVEWKITPDLVANSGLMLEDKEGFDTETSPRLALNYQVNPSHHLRIGATRAYRQPALMETDRLRTLRFQNGDLIDLDRKSHPNIAPEKVNTLEIGYLGYWFNGALSLDAKLFREEIRGAIDMVDTYVGICSNPTPGKTAELADEYCLDFYVDGENGASIDDKVRIVSNTTDWTVEGVEMDLTWKLSNDTWFRFDAAHLNAEGVRIRKVRDYAFMSLQFNKAPRFSAGLLFSHQLSPGWQFSGHFKYTDFIDWRGGTNVYAHSRMDVKLSRSWQWGSSEAEISLTGQNIFNDAYLEYQRNNLFDRRGFVSLTIKWP